MSEQLEREKCCDYGHLASSSIKQPNILKLFPMGGSDNTPPSKEIVLVLCKDHWDAKIQERRDRNAFLRRGTRWHLPDWNMAKLYDVKTMRNVPITEQFKGLDLTEVLL